MRKKVKDLRVVDSQKANEISRKIEEVAQVTKDLHVIYDELTCKPDSEIHDRTVFIAQYFGSNPNIQISDLIQALNNNGYASDWIQLNPDQIMDFSHLTTLIICSEKQGKRNA